MCRIAGFWDFNYKNNNNIEDIIIAMRDVLTYGGPDDAGIYVDNNYSLAFGHRRLSILDLSPLGRQPMSSDDGSLWITYNGEVYNFWEIRDELKSKGYKFKSRTDTEVIIKAYEEWGIDCVHKFRGMWAFALWDKMEGKLILCRDRVGVKPLYWYYKDGLFIFASELKAFHKHPEFKKKLDLNALALYLELGYITAPYSIFENTYKLKPGHFLEINKEGNIREAKYWDIEDYYKEGLELQNNGYWQKISENEIADELEHILTESFKLRLVSDVPVGMFLSGGIDSSIVTALLQKDSSVPIKTFTIGFHEKAYNEAEWAKKVATYLKTDHTELYCTPHEALMVIPKLAEMYDEPFGDSSAIPTHLVSILAKNKVKVSLSADGGDELFCGYTKYGIIKGRIQILSRVPFKNIIRRTLDLLSPDAVFNIYNIFKPLLPRCSIVKDKYKQIKSILSTQDVIKQSIFETNIFMDEDLRELGMQNNYPFLHIDDKYDDLTDMMVFDAKTYLPDDILVKVDRASMSVALEGREPLLDHKILEYLAKLPIEYKYRDGINKYILKKILYRYVPKDLIDRPKQGFSIPLHAWVKGDLKRLYMEYLNESRLEREGIFNAKAVGKILNDSVNGRGVNPNKLWTLLMFEMWKERWL